MGLSIKNDEVEALARELAMRRGISLTEAIRQSLEREVTRDRMVSRKVLEDDDLAKIRAIVESVRAIPERESRMSDDEILGYDESGVPELPRSMR